MSLLVLLGLIAALAVVLAVQGGPGHHPAADGASTSAQPRQSGAAAKSSALATHLAEQKRSWTHSKPPPTEPAPTPTDIVSTPPNGIDNNAQDGPFSSGDFVVSNAWEGTIGGKFFVVYAGQTGSDNPDGGGLAGVREFQGLQTITELGTILDPGAKGPLCIESADGTTLTLSTSSGRTVSFDVAARKFS